ncbi:hypothetical protein [Thermodesulfobacterium hveragerdense]|uniref:hypothetical protein n=1 Tax=Thermodesulfobacterium hveragerdense TaxID=53424 RepID=UPI0004294580|nr:hypothetical protein [Thermodesulfobacterium hveragerdense]
MGNRSEKVSKNLTIEKTLSSIFSTLGYPETILKFNTKLLISLSDISYELILPLIIQEKGQTYFWVDYKPQNFLSCFERGFISLARLVSNPLPFFGAITNLTEFILIDFYQVKTSKGNKEIIPPYGKIKTYTPGPPKPFNPEIETKILRLYLKGG